MAALTKKQTTKAINQIALISGTVACRCREAMAVPGDRRQAACRVKIVKRLNRGGIMPASLRWGVTGDKWQVTRWIKTGNIEHLTSNIE
ncbi:MAG: hypothetical protein WAO02_18385 [Verrucomicrobiia bacterium]